MFFVYYDSSQRLNSHQSSSSTSPPPTVVAATLPPHRLLPATLATAAGAGATTSGFPVAEDFQHETFCAFQQPEQLAQFEQLNFHHQLLQQQRLLKVEQLHSPPARQQLFSLSPLQVPFFQQSHPHISKARLEGTGPPTSSSASSLTSQSVSRRQVRIINSPEDVSLREIFSIADKFGSIEKIEIESTSHTKRNKTRDFIVTMTEVASAQALVNFYSERPTQIRDRVLYFQLTTPDQPKNDVFYQIYRNPNSAALFHSASAAPVEQVNLLNNNSAGNTSNNNSTNSNNNGCDMGSVHSNGNTQAQQLSQQIQQQFQQQQHQFSNSNNSHGNNSNSVDSIGDLPKTVLRVVIENMFYQVSLDNLKQIFSKYGTVTKIITFSKNNAFQALIQYSEASSAQSAKTSLNGQCIFPGCCTMRVDYSKLPSLNVRYNNEKSRDYTDSTLPSGDISPVSFGASPVLYHPASLVTPAYTTTVNIPGIGPALAYCAPTQANIGNLPYNPIALPSATSCLPITSLVGVRVPWSEQMSPVLLVTNLHEELVTPDALFTLFGVYGDVMRVKIMFNKKDNALVQFVDGAQAQIALTHLDKVTLWGKVIKVALSKHSVVQMPKEGQPDSGLTKDYTNSTLHRFKKPNSKNYNNIYPPSATLHLSNIPPTTTEKKLVQLFAQYGCILGFKFFETDHKMALVQMSSAEEAVICLIKLHNYQLAETSHLRVSFSKSTIAAQLSPTLSLKSSASNHNIGNDDGDNIDTSLPAVQEPTQFIVQQQQQQ